MIIEKHTQQSDLARTIGKVERTYTLKPEDNAEDIKINNFINAQKIPKTTLKDFETEELIRKSCENYLGIKLPKSDEAIAFEKAQEISSDIGPETLRSVVEKATKQDAEKEETELKKIVCNCIYCKIARGEL